MLSARFVPISGMTIPQTPAAKRRRASFTAGYQDTIGLLERELRHLKARELLIQTRHEPRDIRLDGWPRSDARVPADPSVVVTFETQDSGSLSFPCDRYTRWEDNLRAVALSLEALRAVDRHGVTRRAEQYRGFAALPAPEAGEIRTTDEAAEVVARVVNEDTGGRVQARDLVTFFETYRTARALALMTTHPDKRSGSREAFDKVIAAVKILDKHHGGS